MKPTVTDHDPASPNPRTRREWLREIGGAGAAALLARTGRAAQSSPTPAFPRERNGAILTFTSATDVFIPPRGRSFQKFSFDFPEVSVAFEGFAFGFRVFTGENVYTLDRERSSAAVLPDRVDLTCTRLVYAGGQLRASGHLSARIALRGDTIECDVTAEMEMAVTAVALVVRGVPRGRLSAAGAPFFDPKDDEVLFGYPFSGGDLFGPQGNSGLTTPLVLVQPLDGAIVALSARDDRVRTKRFYFQPGERGYRVECLVEAEAWQPSRSLRAPTWCISTRMTVAAAGEAHYAHVARAFGVPRWNERADVPGWLRRTALAVTLHGMHYTGYVFNDYARMREILRWIATRIPGERVLVLLAAWDGRYYWDYPVYQASDRMGGEAGFRALVLEGQALGFKMMPMFGANAANRRQPAFERVAVAFTSKADGDRFDLNWVDWNNDRHQDGWLSYMNLGVESWRTWLGDRIADVIDRYHVDAYFLDIVGGWVNNPTADMHEGTRRLVETLRQRFPHAVPVGEMHYDALLALIPLYHSFGQPLVADIVQQHARFFQHLSHPSPGRGSTGVHEEGFGRWDPNTLSLTDTQIPTLSVVDDTFSTYRAAMDAVIQEAKRRAPSA